MKNKKTETKSNWECVTQLIKTQKPLELGTSTSTAFQKFPQTFLSLLSYYKFAAKIIGNDKKVLDTNCGEGLGTYLLSQECGFAKGIFINKQAIESAKENFQIPNLNFEAQDFLKSEGSSQWDAIVSMNQLENYSEENVPLFWEKIVSHLSFNGLAIIGVSRNINSLQSLKNQIQKYFAHVFMFAGHDEVVHPGNYDSAKYVISVGCKKHD